jgi:hypothetical protein
LPLSHSQPTIQRQIMTTFVILRVHYHLANTDSRFTYR